MSIPERDTKFQGFAKALLREIHDPITDYWREDCQEIIARRAYDLVNHTIESIAAMDHDRGPVNISRIDEIFEAEDIPDMTAWSEEEQ